MTPARRVPRAPPALRLVNRGAQAACGVGGAQGSRRTEGARGNRIVAVVEFGPTVRARSVLAGGAGGDPHSPHGTDQAELYTTGRCEHVFFGKRDVEKRLERPSHPGG